MVGLIGIMALPGRLVFTMLGERLARRLVTAALFLLQAIALAVLLLVPGLAGVFGFVVLFGAGFGALTPARAALVAEYYGSTHYARISSVLGLFVTGARAIAPVGAGILYDRLGTYSLIFWVLAGFSALAAGLTKQPGDDNPSRETSGWRRVYRWPPASVVWRLPLPLRFEKTCRGERLQSEAG
jgi:MFS family permease